MNPTIANNAKRKTLTKYKTNPYQVTEKARMLVVFEPDEYACSRLLSLSAPALRVWLYLTTNLQPDGSSSGTLADMRRRFGTPVSTLSRATTELARMGLIQKKRQSEYWMESAVCRVLTVQ